MYLVRIGRYNTIRRTRRKTGGVGMLRFPAGSFSPSIRPSRLPLPVSRGSHQGEGQVVHLAGGHPGHEGGTPPRHCRP